MLEMLLDKKLLFVLMGMLTGLGVADKCIVSMTMKRMIEAAGSMSKSNHPLMRLVRAKFEHACMISDTVENVCLRKYEKMNQKERTVRVNIENGPAEEEIQKDKIQKDEIQKDEIQRDEVQETEAGTEETPASVPDHSVVHMQRENRRRERTQNTAKNLAKASAGLAGMDGSKSPEAEEQKDAPEELAKDEMIRQILREFMA